MPSTIRAFAFRTAIWLTALLVSLGCASLPGGASPEEPRGPRVTLLLQMGVLVPSQGATLSAISIIDERLSAVGLPRVARLLRVTWLPGESFAIDSSGAEYYGITDAIIAADGTLEGCDSTLATSMQDKPCMTSLSHEMLHCSMGSRRGDDGDPEHKLPYWHSCKEDPRPGCGWIQQTEAILTAAGL